MLVLSRRVGEGIVVGDHVRIHIVAIHGSRVRMAISAPDQVPILREELYLKREAFRSGTPAPETDSTEFLRSKDSSPWSWGESQRVRRT
jgi:carbon storage regulator